MKLGEMLWPPQTEGESVPSDQDEQDSGELCEGVIEGGPVKKNLALSKTADHSLKTSFITTNGNTRNHSLLLTTMY